MHFTFGMVWLLSSPPQKYGKPITFEKLFLALSVIASAISPVLIHGGFGEAYEEVGGDCDIFENGTGGSWLILSATDGERGRNLWTICFIYNCNLDRLQYQV